MIPFKKIYNDKYKKISDTQAPSLTLDFGGSKFFTGDSINLKDVLTIVLDNSIKYTKEGGKVTLDISKDENNIIIEISDTGIGIAPDEKYKIFDRFYRVDKARARETGGTGLGLSIALTAVELHGGNIQVESEEGLGSPFRIIIPITFK